MWANAQRVGRSAEYRWRPPFNAAKFGRRPLLEYRASNAAKTRNRLKFVWVPQTRQQISAASGQSSPYCGGHAEEILLLNKFFSDCRFVPCEDAQMAIFGNFLRAVFSVSRVQHVSDVHPKFALRPHHVWKYGRHPICDGGD